MELKDKTNPFIAKSRQFLFLQRTHIRSVNHYRTAIGLVKCTDNLKQSRFSGTARPHDTYHLALPYREVDAFQHSQTAKTLGYPFYFYHDCRLLIIHFSGSGWISISIHGRIAYIPLLSERLDSRKKGYSQGQHIDPDR